MYKQLMIPIDSDKYKFLTYKYGNFSINEIAFKKPEGITFDYNFFLEQLTLLRKCEKKLPTFFNNRLFLTVKGYEQASSEICAQYKSSLFNDGDICLDLTGGLGVDDLYLSKKFKKIISLDTDQVLNEIVDSNLQVLKLYNIKRLSESAESYILNNSNEVDLIYIDPDRRVNQIRQKSLVNWSPDIHQLWDKLTSISKHIMVKLSPLTDIHYLTQHFPGIFEIHVVAVKNETREVLAMADKNVHSNIRIIATHLTENHIFRISSLEEFSSIITTPQQENWIFEPNHAIIHSRLWRGQFPEIIQPNNCIPLFIVGKKTPLLAGRCLKVVKKFEGSFIQLKAYLKKSAIKQLNISTRGLPIKQEELLKKLRVEGGGELYLFSFPDRLGKYIHIIAKQG